MNDDFTIIRSMSGQSNSLVIPKIYLQLTGDLNSALILSQCIFWSDKGGRKDGYIYKTKAEWENETSLTRHEFDSAKNRLVESGFVDFQVKRANGHGTLHFKVDTDKLMQALRTVEYSSNHSEEEIDNKIHQPESGELADIQSVQCPKTGELRKPKTGELRKPESGELRKPDSGDLLTVNNTINNTVNKEIDEIFNSGNPVLFAREHPMIQLWQSITGNGMIPGKQHWESIITFMYYFVDKLGGKDKAKEYLYPYWIRWKNGRRKANGQPFDKFGINWLTEWAVQGQDPNTIPNGTDSRDGGYEGIHFDNL